ncbi:Splicing factor YJU2 [[Candida] zeylanoides]
MSERKAINKYYPPDWDPSKVPKRQKTGSQDIKVRLMAPFSMRCTKCNEYIAERRKFNAKKEVTKEVYMDVKIIRFHITCPRCNNKITFKTSPQTAGYVPETGAVRNHEPRPAAAAATAVSVETEDQILERLEREDRENQSYQVLKEKRKRNPFWTKDDGLKNGEGSIIENLSKRLLQQHRENAANEELEQLQAKQESVRLQGGKDAVTRHLQTHIASELDEQARAADVDDDDAAQRAFKRFRSTMQAEPSKQEERSGLSGEFKTKIVVRAKRSPPGDIANGLPDAGVEAVNTATVAKPTPGGLSLLADYDSSSE